jgi:hypothetical protein
VHRRQKMIRGNKALTPQWRQLTDGLAISGYDKTFAQIKTSHNFSRIIPKLSLRNNLRHEASVALSATSSIPTF